MKKIFLILLSISLAAVSVGGMIVLSPDIGITQPPPPPPPPPPGIGDGYLLKRSQAETCHACHKTNVNTPSPGTTGYVQTEWDNAIKMHSAETLGTCNPTTYKTKTACTNNGGTWTPGKWGTDYPNVGWGVSGGKYGEIVCITCHTAHGTKNIYLIKEVITTPDGTNWGSSGESRTPAAAVGSVDLQLLAASPPPPDSDIAGRMGRAGETRTSSTRVCEVCHSFYTGPEKRGVK